MFNLSKAYILFLVSNMANGSSSTSTSRCSIQSPSSSVIELVGNLGQFFFENDELELHLSLAVTAEDVLTVQVFGIVTYPIRYVFLERSETRLIQAVQGKVTD